MQDSLLMHRLRNHVCLPKNEVHQLDLTSMRVLNVIAKQKLALLIGHRYVLPLQPDVRPILSSEATTSPGGPFLSSTDGDAVTTTVTPAVRIVQHTTQDSYHGVN